ncbi:MAG TPA: metal-dependent hydrolase [Candidatus Angelobacter sp.]|nr:metal-dependent hydrolase [Candidatus Angelobacter sp.]
MFIGHIAVGFASKRFAPRTSLAALIAAPIFLDLLWPVFLLLGWEHVRIVPGITRYNPLDLYDFPWSHSLLMSVVWATAFSLIYYGLSKYRPGALAIWIGVVSHWILDWITHRPDMPLYPGGGLKLGLGVWNHVAATMTVEIAMLAVGVWIYVRVTTARDRIGRFAFLAYVVVLLVLFIGDRFSSTPPTVSEIIWSGLIAEVVLLAWPWWFDRHRDAHSPVTIPPFHPS